MSEIKLTTMEAIRAFSDPYRLKILNNFYMRGQPSTVKEISDQMGEVPAKVHYHVKKLEKHGILLQVYTKEINGIIAKYYEPAAESFSVENPDLKNNSSPGLTDQYEAFIASIFDEAKFEFINSIRHKADKKGTVSTEVVYLTDQEYDNYVRYIKELCEKCKKPKGDNAKPYYLFASTIRADKGSGE